MSAYRNTEAGKRLERKGKARKKTWKKSVMKRIFHLMAVAWGWDTTAVFLGCTMILSKDVTPVL